MSDKNITQNSSESRFPLYRPQQHAQEIPLTADTLAALPSEQALSRQLKRRVTQKAIENLPEFTEDELRDFYATLVKSGSKDNGGYIKLWKHLQRQRKFLCQKREGRDLNGHGREAGWGAGLALLKDPARYGKSLELVVNGSKSSDAPYAILDILSQAAILSGPSETSKGKAVEGQLPLRSLEVPLGLVTSKEWDALFQEFVSFLWIKYDIPAHYS